MFTIFWVGGAWLALLLGDVWWRIDPYLAFGRLCDRVRRARAARTPGGDPDAVPDVVRRWWTAPLVLATFVIIWTADPLGDQPRAAVWLLGFSVIVGLGAIQSGVRGVADLDPFPSVFGLAAACGRGPVAATLPPEARPAPTPPAPAVPTAAPPSPWPHWSPAATFFDRLKGTLVFLRTVKVRTPFTAWIENVLVLGWAAGLVAALWWGLGLLTSRTLRTPGMPTTRRRPPARAASRGLLLAASLGPIAMRALLAHTFSTLLVQVQNVLVLASDPSPGVRTCSEPSTGASTPRCRCGPTPGSSWRSSPSGTPPRIWIVRGTCQAAAVPPMGRARRSDRQRSLPRAALPAFGVIIVSGIAWTLLLLGT